jgi:hypothetical protein
MAEPLVSFETRPFPARGARAPRAPFPACPPRPGVVGASARFQASIAALERRIARSGDPAQEGLLTKVRQLGVAAAGLERVEASQVRRLQALREAAPPPAPRR